MIFADRISSRIWFNTLRASAVIRSLLSDTRYSFIPKSSEETVAADKSTAIAIAVIISQRVKARMARAFVSQRGTSAIERKIRRLHSRAVLTPPLSHPMGEGVRRTGEGDSENRAKTARFAGIAGNFIGRRCARE